MSGLSDADYRQLLVLQTGLRRYLRWNDEQAERHGLTPAQHQLLVAIRGHDEPAGPTVGQVADYLVLRHNSAVGLVDRAAQAGLVERVPDPDEHRAVRLRLSARGATVVAQMAVVHEENLSRLRDHLEPLGEDLPRPSRPPVAAKKAAKKAAPAAKKAAPRRPRL